MTQPEQFRQYVEKSERILVTSHITPDPDALSSAGLLGATLRLNYPGIHVVTALEDKPFNMADTPFYGDITFGPMDVIVSDTKPDLFIVTDTNMYSRISLLGAAAIKKYLQDNPAIRTIIIDHHMPEGAEDVDLYIQNTTPAAVQNVYELLFHNLGMEKPEGFAELTMLGIVSDSLNLSVPRDYATTKKILNELEAHGATREAAVAKLEQLSENQRALLDELKQNRLDSGTYIYSYISDETAELWRSQGMSMQELKQACGTFSNYRMISDEGSRWGFIVYPVLEDKNLYGLSFRSRDPDMDMSAITHSLGNGGGHKGAAGAKITASTLKDVLETVHGALQKYR